MIWRVSEASETLLGVINVNKIYMCVVLSPRNEEVNKNSDEQNMPREKINKNM